MSSIFTFYNLLLEILYVFMSDTRSQSQEVQKTPSRITEIKENNPQTYTQGCSFRITENQR